MQPVPVPERFQEPEEMSDRLANLRRIIAEDGVTALDDLIDSEDRIFIELRNAVMADLTGNLWD